MGAFAMTTTLNRLGVPRRSGERPWTDAEKDTVRRLYSIEGPTKLAKLLDRTIGSVAGLAARMKLQRPWHCRYEPDPDDNR